MNSKGYSIVSEILGVLISIPISTYLREKRRKEDARINPVVVKPDGEDDSELDDDIDTED